MLTLTGIGTQLRRLQRLAFSIGRPHHMRVWSNCRHCGTKTRQGARPIDGYYHCLQCGRNPNEEPDANDSSAPAPTAQ